MVNLVAMGAFIFIVFFAPNLPALLVGEFLCSVRVSYLHWLYRLMVSCRLSGVSSQQWDQLMLLKSRPWLSEAILRHTSTSAGLSVS